jgi:hypothetical protein
MVNLRIIFATEEKSFGDCYDFRLDDGASVGQVAILLPVASHFPFWDERS